MYVGKSRRGGGSAAAVAIAAASVLIGTTSSFAPSSTRRVCPQHSTFCEQAGRLPTATELNLKLFEKAATEEKTNVLTTKKVKANGASRASATALVEEEESSWLDGVDDEKKFELIALGIWGVSISAFILINNFYGPWPTFMKAVPGRSKSVIVAHCSHATDNVFTNTMPGITRASILLGSHDRWYVVWRRHHHDYTHRETSGEE